MRTTYISPKALIKLAELSESLGKSLVTRSNTQSAISDIANVLLKLTEQEEIHLFEAASYNVAMSSTSATLLGYQRNGRVIDILSISPGRLSIR